jgi:hypothetical protein
LNQLMKTILLNQHYFFYTLFVVLQTLFGL